MKEIEEPAISSPAVPPAQPSILVVGSLNLDLMLYVPLLPASGETKTAESFARLPGGKGANQAVAASRLGAATTMLGCVGEDDGGSLLETALREAGVETRFILRGNEPTGTAVILLAPSGENSIILAPGANALLTQSYVQLHRARIAAAGMVLTQLETPIAALSVLLAITEEAGVPLMLDPAPAVPLAPAILKKVTWFTPNETEAAFYGNITATEAVADMASAAESGEGLCNLCKLFQKLGPRNILLKLGSRGACVLTEAGEFFHVPAPFVKAIDTTGAGDILNAAFAFSLLSGKGVEHSLRYAVAAASLAVTRRGAMAGAPTDAETRSFMGDKL
jgi:ribokinase